MFYAELTKIIPNDHEILPLILSSGTPCWCLLMLSLSGETRKHLGMARLAPCFLCRVNKNCRASLMCFWSNLINWISKDIYMVFYLLCIIRKFEGIKTLKQMKNKLSFVQMCRPLGMLYGVSRWCYLTIWTLLSWPKSIYRQSSTQMALIGISW